jgi:hypothetical protein
MTTLTYGLRATKSLYILLIDIIEILAKGYSVTVSLIRSSNIVIIYFGFSSFAKDEEQNLFSRANTRERKLWRVKI